jgi:dipeptidyl aminopeptidase/acylaminoacyl peptidase
MHTRTRSITRVVALLVTLLPAALAAQAPAAAGGKLTLDLYLELEGVSDPRVSPDGTQIIYTRQWVDKVNDKRESSLWIMNADGSRNRVLVPEGANARWSPNGDRIAFVAQGKPKGSQIFVRWMDAEGAVSQISHLDESPSSIAWSPDGKQIGFAMQVDQNTTWTIKMPKGPDGAKWTEAPKIVERMKYRQDRQGYTDTGYRHLFVLPSGGGTPRQITTGNFDHNAFEWTPDGKTLVFSSLHADDAEHQFRESEIYAVDVASGAEKQLTRRKGPDANPVVSPDGTKIAYTGYDWTRDSWIDSKLYVMGIDGSNPRLAAAAWDRSPSELTWAADSSGIYFNAQNEGAENLYFVPLTGNASGTVQPVTKGMHMLSVTDVTAKGKAVGTLTSYYKPADIVSFDLKNPGAITQLTFVNEDILAGKKLGKVEEIWYTAPDGVKVQGWYMTPPDFDASRKYPLQLHIHGGPHSMYGSGFNYGWQEMAANGYVILYTNPRGSTGYGSKFGNMIANAYPGPDYDDLMAGVDEMLKKGFVDPRNLFVTGCSGGGILTAWIVTKTDRFAAASSNCTIVEWMSLAGTTDGQFSYYRFPKLPWEDPAPWIAHSSIFHVGKVKTPTMLMTGEQDLRTPMPQAEMFYRALKFLNVPTALVRFKNEWHGTTSTPSNFMRTQLYLRHWFDKFKRAGTTSTAAGQR